MLQSPTQTAISLRSPIRHTRKGHGASAGRSGRTAPGRQGRGLAAAVLAASLALSAGACESTPVAEKAKSPQQRAAEVPLQIDEFGKLGYRLDWRGFATMLPGQTVRFFDTLGDVVCVQESAGVVSVLEAKSGVTRWSDQAAGPLTKFVGNVRDGDRLIVSSEAEAYFYDIASGNLKDKQRLAVVASTRPVQVQSILVYGCGNGQLLGHLMLNGFRQWGSTLGGPIESPLLELPRGRIATVSATGDIAVVDGLTGLFQARNRMYGGTATRMDASDGLIFVASLDQSLYAFAIDSCALVWRKRTDAPLHQPPTFHDGRVYCDMGAAGLSCFEAATGKELWTNARLHGEVVAFRNKRLILWDGAVATTIDPAKGVAIDSVPLQNVSMLRPDQFADGHLYAVSPSGVVAKLSPR